MDDFEEIITCDRCAEQTPKEESIPEGELNFCRSCYDLLLEMGEV